MKDLTREQAVALFESAFWQHLTPCKVAWFQLVAERMCVPLPIFRASLEVCLGRGLVSGELLEFERLRAELAGRRLAPTLEEVMAFIPEDKRVVKVGE